ncbi:hypothetical protein TNIN_166531 [Trichonephila inaurata madagascariensis]|uniref:Uncharacterized protein n=1 Tax=Trichonephila inaurata madagascariensis TaxID=2747483 RepID=A0A8X6XRN2_9ARAC|nr:hypothetical protein TNIN_166531 [Trichonephila inaurata madagascariensis]
MHRPKASTLPQAVRRIGLCSENMGVIVECVTVRKLLNIQLLNQTKALTTRPLTAKDTKFLTSLAVLCILEGFRLLRPYLPRRSQVIIFLTGPYR